MRKLKYRVYYTRYQVSFYLWKIKLSQRHPTLQTYYVTGCLQIFHLDFKLLMIKVPGKSHILAKHKKTYKTPPTNCSWNLPNINFWPKGNMKSSANRKLSNLKLSRNLFPLKAWHRLQNIKNVKILRFEVRWTSYDQRFGFTITDKIFCQK